MKKFKAIVLKARDKKEKDKDILLFYIEEGKAWATLKGVKSPSAKMKQAQIPFTFGEFILEEGKAGNIVTSFEAIESFREFSEDVDKYFAGMGVLEVINCLEFSSAAERAKIFVLVLRALKTICFKKINPIYALDKFLIELFAETGTEFSTEKCSVCGSKSFDKLHINYLTGELVCAGCKDFNCEELSKTTFMALKILKNTDFDRLESLKLSSGSEVALLRILSRNFEARFDTKAKFIGILS